MPFPTPASVSQIHPATLPPIVKPEPKVIQLPDQPSSSSSTAHKRIDGFEEDVALAKSQYLTRTELLKRRSRRVKQLARIYRDHYWALMDELKLKFREYYWEFGKSPYQEDEDVVKVNGSRGDCKIARLENAQENGNMSGIASSGRCGIHGCKAKAMALTRFCHMHILSDSKQKLYKACNFSIKSSTTGPILCGKPILRSTVPSYCPIHFQKAEKHMTRALKKAGLHVSSIIKLTPKLHVIIVEYVRQIQNLRKAAPKACRINTEVKKNTSILEINV